MEQNEAVKDAIQPDIGVGKDIILLRYEHNVSQCSWEDFTFISMNEIKLERPKFSV